MMSENKTYIPTSQFVELQASIAEAILYAQIIDHGFYIQTDDDGNECYTEEGQEEFEERYEQAQFILNDCGLHSGPV